MDESGTVLAHRILPVSLLQNGYRHIYLRDRYNLPLGLASLFVQVGIGGFRDRGVGRFRRRVDEP